MKKFFLISVFILFLIPLFSLAENSHLLITEVQIEGETTSQDFVKIYNPRSNPLDISGYKLRKRSSTGKEYSIRVFPKGSKIDAQSYFLWANSKDGYSETVGANIESTATISKNNSIALFDKEGNRLDALCWGESQNPFKEGSCFPENPGKNQQLKRIKLNNVYQDTNNNEADFQLSSPSGEPESEGTMPSENLSPNIPPIAEAGEDIFTQTGEEIVFDGSKSSDPDGDKLSFFWNFGDGQTSKEESPKHIYAFPGKYIVILEVSDGKDKNSDRLVANISAKGVILNEVFPNPSSGEEWIEILNTNNFIVDISGWEIKDSSGKTFSFPRESFIMPHQFLIIDKTLTHISLNNNGDSISFLYPSGTLIEKLTYDKSQKDWAVAKNAKGDFIWTNLPTPGLPNIFTSKLNTSQKTDILEKIAKDNKELADSKIAPPITSSLSESKFNSSLEPKNETNLQKLQASAKNSFKNISIFLIVLLFSLFAGFIILVIKKKYLDRI